jgi:hypothetical protein
MIQVSVQNSLLRNRISNLFDCFGFSQNYATRNRLLSSSYFIKTYVFCVEWIIIFTLSHIFTSKVWNGDGRIIETGDMLLVFFRRTFPFRNFHFLNWNSHYISISVSSCFPQNKTNSHVWVKFISCTFRKRISQTMSNRFDLSSIN